MKEKAYQQKTIKKAKEIAIRAHSNQFRKGGNIPYIQHPQDVVRRVGNNWELSVVAWLHDVLEQSNEDRNSLIQQGIPEYLVKEIEILSHAKNISYRDYIDNIAKSKIATQVKIADILSNLSDLPSIAQIQRYSEALIKLTKPYTEKNGKALDNSSIEELVEDIRDGIISHSNDPIGWLTSFIDNLDEEISTGIIAEKRHIPEHLKKLKRPPNAIIVDCGTGETKILFYGINKDKIIFTEVFKLNAVSQYIDKSDDFINTIRYYLTKHHADIVLIAASAWLREASQETLYKGNILLTQLLDSGMLCKILEPREEAWMELAAAEYVSNKLGLNINGTYSSGAGSTQFTKNFENVYSFRLGNETGRKLISEKGLIGIEEWKRSVNITYSDSELQLDGLILCFSAVWHAAAVCGLQLNTIIQYDKVTSTFEGYIKKQSTKTNLSPLDIRNLSNVIQHFHTIKSTISNTSNLIFIRDIDILDHNLRITWSLGWYIELLNQLQFLEIKNKTLQRFRKEQSKIGKIGQEVGKEIIGTKMSSTATGHVLLDISQTADIILRKANNIEKLVTPKLEANCVETGARLEGLEFRMKTRESLIRKLNSRLKKLIASHTSLQFYIPRLTDIFNEVDDVLRYTILAETEKYTSTTLSFLENLKKEFDCDIKCFSFWERNSTYLGINSFITISNFTFEIQFHTHESWNLKQSESHNLYEIFRTLPNCHAKFILYSNMKEIWSKIPIPPKVLEIERISSSVDPLMEQYGLIRKLKEIRKNETTIGTIESEELKNNVCIRLIRGRSPEEFEYISFPPSSKKLSWVSSGEILFEILRSKPAELQKVISDFSGKTLSWVNKEMQEGYKWKILVIPKQNCTIADWDGVFRLIQELYPIVSPIILRFKKQLVDLTFNEIEQQIYPQSRFRDIKDNPINNTQYIDEAKLVELESPLLWQVRGFLYNVIGLNENFRGDGNVYNASSKKMHAEFLIPNQKIKLIFGAQILELG
jgi:hypothetical protein